ncbi:hypothetical protein HDU76_002891 [Blyttiomyces sp. JEL0837]|nr:hypothetical protein HDU76_002891 [Blyttiomyces sp. JEL0837]
MYKQTQSWEIANAPQLSPLSDAQIPLLEAFFTVPDLDEDPQVPGEFSPHPSEYHVRGNALAFLNIWKVVVDFIKTDVFVNGPIVYPANVQAKMAFHLPLDVLVEIVKVLPPCKDIFTNLPLVSRRFNAVKLTPVDISCTLILAPESDGFGQQLFWVNNHTKPSFKTTYFIISIADCQASVSLKALHHHDPIKIIEFLKRGPSNLHLVIHNGTTDRQNIQDLTPLAGFSGRLTQLEFTSGTPVVSLKGIERLTNLQSLNIASIDQEACRELMASLDNTKLKTKLSNLTGG